MSDAPEPTPDVHPAALLLPWSVNGQLSAAERREIEEHLAACPGCQAELASLTALRADIHEMAEQAPGPSVNVRRRVMSQVRARTERVGVLEQLAAAARFLLRPKWAPALVMLVIVGQMGALLWLERQPSSPPVISRGLPSRAVRLRIYFNPDAQQRMVQSAIRDIGGRVIDGPAADGAYIVELASAPPSVISAKLQGLRARPDIVTRFELASP